MRVLTKACFSFILIYTLQSCLYKKNDAVPAGSSTTNTTDGTTGGTGNTGGTGSTGGTSNLTCSSPSSGTVTNPTGVCFNSQILPFFQSNCAKSGCHDTKTKAEGYDLSTYAGILKKGISKTNPASSTLYKVMIDTGKNRMPPSPAAKLTTTQTDLVLTWIKEGAKETNCTVVINSENPTYSGTIKPYLDVNCVGCHQSGNASGGVILDNYNNVKAMATNGTFVGVISYATEYRPMPPSYKSSDCQITAVQNWIKNGAKND